MMKIVINGCFGGFSLSAEATKRLKEMGLQVFGIERNDPALVAVVEEMGKAANGMYAQLEIVDVPDDVEWTIEEYDGTEWVAEKHRIWGRGE